MKSEFKFLFAVFAVLVMSISALAKAGEAPTGGSPSGASGGNSPAGQIQTEVEVKNAGENSQIRTEENVQAGDPGVGEQAQEQERLRDQTSPTNEGKPIEVLVNGSIIKIKRGNSTVRTSLIVSPEKRPEGTILKAKLSNGRNAEIKVMPDTAAERALDRLRLKVCSEANNCTMELKEVGSGEQTRAVYEVQVERRARILGIFPAKFRGRFQMDAENGEVLVDERPWWAFLVTME